MERGGTHIPAAAVAVRVLLVRLSQGMYLMVVMVALVEPMITRRALRSVPVLASGLAVEAEAVPPPVTVGPAAEVPSEPMVRLIQAVAVGRTGRWATIAVPEVPARQ